MEQVIENADKQEAIAVPEMLTPMQMMAAVLKTSNPKEAVEVIKELAKLQMEMQKHDATMQLRTAEIEFNQALQAAQAEMKAIINDSDPAKLAPWGKRWATYRALNKEVRPVCKRHGIGISYDTKPSAVAEQMIVLAYVSKGLYTRPYEVPMDISGKGPSGGGALTKPNAVGAGLEYARRDLLRMIFDLITGEEGDFIDQGNVDISAVKKHLNQIEAAGNDAALKQAFEEAIAEAKNVGDAAAQAKYNHAKNKRYRDIHQKGGQQ